MIRPVRFRKVLTQPDPRSNWRWSTVTQRAPIGPGISSAFYFIARRLLIPGHWIEAGVLYFNSSSDRPNTVSSANVQGSVLTDPRSLSHFHHHRQKWPGISTQWRRPAVGGVTLGRSFIYELRSINSLTFFSASASISASDLWNHGSPKTLLIPP